MSRRVIAGIGLLLLTTGCLARGLGQVAADILPIRPLPTSPHDAPGGQDAVIPVLHLPDATITAREPRPRWEANFHAALLRSEPAPLVAWSLFASGVFAVGIAF